MTNTISESNPIRKPPAHCSPFVVPRSYTYGWARGIGRVVVRQMTQAKAENWLANLFSTWCRLLPALLLMNPNHIRHPHAFVRPISQRGALDIHPIQIFPQPPRCIYKIS